MSPIAAEIRSVSPLADVLPRDVVSHATLVASSMLATIEEVRQGVVMCINDGSDLHAEKLLQHNECPCGSFFAVLYRTAWTLEDPAAAAKAGG